MKPLSKFEPQSNKKTEHPASVVWARILDKRFCYEVRRTDNPYEGKLLIFDGKNDFKLLHEYDVGISYAAQFGPDAYDAEDWDHYVADWVDRNFLPEQEKQTNER